MKKITVKVSRPAGLDYILEIAKSIDLTLAEDDAIRRFAKDGSFRSDALAAAINKVLNEINRRRRLIIENGFEES